ncbi:SCO1860 family LAETG-anchored protein [Streptomyces sp. NPDC006733]|uniref:SCO1860 family LAETG-anchored protein n=1 Tax=Streptomyces sp. NPDC006733 TaxID=3155460 RepID=UPI0033EFA3A7
MYSSNFSLPARRSAAALGAAVALAAGALVVAPAAQAHPSGNAGGTSGGRPESGKSTATVLRAGLDVSLLNKTVDVPLNVSLNDVKAPADADETALTAQLAGVDNGKPFSMLRADVATARATADTHKAEGYANLARAEVHLPGLPALSLIRIEAVTSKATCEAGRKPTASATLAGVWVLNKKITLTATGTTKVAVPGVGEVSLDLSKTETTTRTAAATGLELKVKVNPGNLNVADVSGTVTLVKATCEAPKVVDPTTGGTTHGGTTGGATHGGTSTGGTTHGGTTNGGTANGGATNGGTSGGTTSGGASGGSSGGDSGASGGSSGASGSGGTGGSGGSQPQTGPTTQNLAETGSSSNTPLLAAGAAGLVAVGGGALYLTSRRRKAAQAVADAEAAA